jgi:glycosyltransferase involved in cell wall biosynthesis
VKRVLHIFPLCGRAGTEAVMRFLISGLAQAGIESEAFFQRDIGGRDLFEELCPVHFEDDRSLRDVLARGNFDAIHAVTSAITIGVPEAVAATRFQGPVVVACHNDYIIGWNRCNANAVVALTDWWARKIRPYTDLPVEVIGNPVDLERFRPPAELAPGVRPILAWIGRSADPKKNVARLMSVIRELPRDRYEIRVADTDTRDDPAEVFGDLASRLSWYGRLHYSRMPDFYREIAESGGVLLSTSDDEAFPMCVLEAMASGCPVVVPDAWGSEEIVEHGQAGLIYRRAEATREILACLEQLRDVGKRRRIATGARARVEANYSLDAVTRRYLEVFQQAAATRRRNAVGARAAWAVRSGAFYLRRPPESLWLYRPRRAAEALERALRANEAGKRETVKAALLEALRMNPTVYLRPWRAKFLLRTLLSAGERR